MRGRLAFYLLVVATFLLEVISLLALIAHDPEGYRELAAIAAKVRP